MSFSAGFFQCDVCGNIIWGFTRKDTATPVKIRGIEQTLHVHTIKCKAILKKANGDWEKLPEGPLKKAFRDAADKLKLVEEK